MNFDRSGENPSATERWDRVLAVLAAEPRRILIYSLVGVPDDEPLPLPEAADSPNLSIPYDVLCTRLRHNHLPALSAAGYVEWEADPFRAYRGPNFEEAKTVIEALFESVDRYPSELIDGYAALERDG